MKYEQKDIIKLIDSATPEERKGIGMVLDLNDKKELNGTEIAEQLWLEYQTFFGYIVRTPPFDEICVSVAEKFIKIKSVDKYDSCWDILNETIKFLFEKMFNEMSKDEKAEFAKEVLTEEEFKDTLGDLNKIKWSKIAAAMALLTSRHSLTIYAIISSQIATALIGRTALTAAGSSVFLPFMGPLGWFILAFGINDLLGTNWKQVVPATLFIYCIYERLKQEGNLPF